MAGYRDFSHLITETPSSHSEQKLFPERLYHLLAHLERNGLAGVAAWQPHGRSFKILMPEQLKEMLVNHFDTIKSLQSLEDALGDHGFHTLTQGADTGGYYHEYFLRNRECLLHLILKKPRRAQPRRLVEDEPRLWHMKWMEPLDDPSQTYVADTVQRLRNSFPAVSESRSARIRSASVPNIGSVVVIPNANSEAENNDKLQFCGQPFHYFLENDSDKE